MAGIHRTPTSIAPSDGPLALPALDLNLLKVFAAVHHFCQVTAAARQLDMTPSAVSNALTRLRGHCGDALFVRTQRGVVPTPYANRLALAVSNGLNAFALGLQPDAPFTPASSERIFRVNVADVGQMLMIGSVMRSMAGQKRGTGAWAPGCCGRWWGDALPRPGLHARPLRQATDNGLFNGRLHRAAVRGITLG